MQGSRQEPELIIDLGNRIDTANAQDVESKIFEAIAGKDAARVQLDAKELSYLSSMGLRIIVRLCKRVDQLSIVNVEPAVYDVFEMTGINELVTVRRKRRDVSLEGLRQIGAGAFGRVYRLDEERVMKVYDPRIVPLDRIERERESARQAFIHDIPSAIPFETVRVGSENGIIYELIDARTLGEVVAADPDRLDERAKSMARLARKLHSTHFEEGLLPDARLIFHGWIDLAERSGLYERETIAKLRAFVEAIPPSDTFVHGDFHPANIMVMPDDELLLIDMGDASVGDPIIDIAGAFHVVRVAARRPGGAERLTGMPGEMLERLWAVFLRTYYDLRDDEDLSSIERQLRYAALPRTMGSIARSKLITDEVRRRQAREAERAFLAGINH